MSLRTPTPHHGNHLSVGNHSTSHAPAAHSGLERKISPEVIITPRRSTMNALDGNLSAHATRHIAHGESDIPTAPLAHRPSLVRFGSSRERLKRHQDSAADSPPLDAMAGFHAMQADTEAMELRAERRRQKLISSGREASAASISANDYSAAQSAQAYPDENASASFDFDDFASALDEEKGDSEARRSKQKAASTSSPTRSAAAAPNPRSSPSARNIMNTIRHMPNASFDLDSQHPHARTPPLFEDEEKRDRESADRPVKNVIAEPVPRVPQSALSPASAPTHRSSNSLNLSSVGNSLRTGAGSGSGSKSPSETSQRASPEQSPKNSIIGSSGGQGAFGFDVGTRSSPVPIRSLGNPSTATTSTGFPIRSTAASSTDGASKPNFARQPQAVGGFTTQASQSQSVPNSPLKSPSTLVQQGGQQQRSLVIQSAVSPSSAAGSTVLASGERVPTRPSVQPLSVNPSTPSSSNQYPRHSPLVSAAGNDKYSAMFAATANDPTASPITPNNMVNVGSYGSSTSGSSSVPPTPSTSTTGRFPPPVLQTSVSATSASESARRSTKRVRNVSWPQESADMVRQEQSALPRSKLHNRGGIRPILKLFVSPFTTPINTRPNSPQAPQSFSGGAGGGGASSPLSPQARLQRYRESLALDQACIRAAQSGASLVKYNSSGKPQRRWFFVEEHEDEWALAWEAVKKDGVENRTGLDLPSPTSTSPGTSSPPNGLMSPTHKKAASSSSGILPFFQIGKWKFNPERQRSLIDVTGIHYGPYYSVNFCSFLDQLSSDKSSDKTLSGKPWLCFSIQTKDRTIDLMCETEAQVTKWFLALQALAPLSVFHLTRPMILWQRLIMKLNFHGLESVKDSLLRHHPDHHLHNASLAASVAGRFSRMNSNHYGKAFGGQQKGRHMTDPTPSFSKKVDAH